MKKLLLTILLVTLLIPLSGCTSRKTFDKNDFKITLTNEFIEGKKAKINYFFKSNDVGVAILKEEFENLKISNLDKDSTLEDYRDLIANQNSEDIKIKKEKNFYYFSYTNESYYYLTAMYKGKDAFWLVNFFTVKENGKKLENTLLKYAKSVEVK